MTGSIHFFYHSANTVRVTKSGGEQENHALLWLKNLKEGEHMGNLVSNWNVKVKYSSD
jgi:hypothetical protein